MPHLLNPSDLSESGGPVSLSNSQPTGIFASNLVGGRSTIPIM